MTSLYTKSTHSFTEQPTMERPADYINSTSGFDNEKWNKEWRAYNAHLSSLRTIPAQPGSVWEDGKIYEEGKDYHVLDFSNGRGNHQFEAVPIPKEDDQPNREIIENILYSAGIPQSRATEIAEAILNDIKPQHSFSREDVEKLIEECIWESYGHKDSRFVAKTFLDNKFNSNQVDSTKL